MNRKIGMISSLINMSCVLFFALCMLFRFNFGSYLICMFIAFSFVPMISAFCNTSEANRKTAGYSAMIFAGIFAAIIILVYFAQITAVRLDGLNEQALQILDYSKFGLLFSYDLLGYGVMALSTFFAGLTIQTKNVLDKILKWLLIIHGIFFFSCLIMPMLGVFSSKMQGGDLIVFVHLNFGAYILHLLDYFHFYILRILKQSEQSIDLSVFCLFKCFKSKLIM